jgi:predicted dehydrogenase
MRSLARSPYVLEKMRAPLQEPSYRAALSGFVSAAQTHTHPAPDLLDGYRSLAVVLAAEESARTGRPISIAESLDEGRLIDLAGEGEKAAVSFGGKR